MLKELQSWVKGKKDYKVGVALLSSFTNNKGLAHVLSLPGAHIALYNRKRLELEISNEIKRLKSLTAPKKNITTSAAPKTAKKKPVLSRKVNYPEELHKYIDEQDTAYNTRMLLHWDLEKTANPTKRVEMRENIRFLTKRIYQVWTALDYWEKHQVILPTFDNKLPAAEIKRLERRYDTVETYISRYKKLAESTDDVNKKASYKIFQDKYSEELAALKTKLGKR